MNNNRILNFIHFLHFLNSRKNFLYEDFTKQKELQGLMQTEKINSFFQPILSLESGSTIGFEVLNRPQSSSLFPTTEQFYDYVGKSNKAFMVEHFLRKLSFERFTEQIKDNRDHKDQLMFLNIQTQILADPNFRSGITLELLKKHHLSPYQIVLELTEKESISNSDQFERAIDHYQQQGFRIAIDDAGTGYNSLQTLVRVKPEFIKLDKSLIRNIDKHPKQQYLVELLLEFALQSDTSIIAEGIETVSELMLLKKLGLHLGQGYALGKPMPQLCDGHLPLSEPIIQKNNVHIN
jgi:EAL domain-containing protein (putative c-di-GMP-specific phosphodiesterase class I)